ncbi:hypothetical protein L1887_11297 [Cichorium endivia]|nr:hypothetical protein L1887_11297 [Cichorium endivia]
MIFSYGLPALANTLGSFLPDLVVAWIVVSLMQMKIPVTSSLHDQSVERLLKRVKDGKIAFKQALTLEFSTSLLLPSDVKPQQIDLGIESFIDGSSLLPFKSSSSCLGFGVDLKSIRQALIYVLMEFLNSFVIGIVLQSTSSSYMFDLSSEGSF